MSATGGGGKKRGPGRPPKAQKPPPLPKRGIVEKPDRENDRLELVYDNPMAIKKIFTYFEKLSADTLYWLCTPRGITIFTRDQHAMSKVIVEFHGSEMNLFYCGAPFLFSMRRKVVKSIFASIDKTYYKATITASLDTPDRVSIVFKDFELAKECTSRVDVVIHEERPEEEEDLFKAREAILPPALAAAPVSFELSAKKFKKSVADAARQKVSKLIIEKLGEYPLQFVYHLEGVSYNEVYHKPEAIQLRSSVAADGLMRCTLGLVNIKSLSTAMVADRVTIFCYPDGSGDDVVFVSTVGDDDDDDGDGESHGAITISTVLASDPDE